VVGSEVVLTVGGAVVYFGQLPGNPVGMAWRFVEAEGILGLDQQEIIRGTNRAGSGVGGVAQAEVNALGGGYRLEGRLMVAGKGKPETGWCSVLLSSGAKLSGTDGHSSDFPGGFMHSAYVIQGDFDGPHLKVLNILKVGRQNFSQPARPAGTLALGVVVPIMPDSDLTPKNGCGELNDAGTGRYRKKRTERFGERHSLTV
jgi:hypothetical protein